MKQDIMEVEILADGTFKVTTDKVSMPNHTNAEGLLRSVFAQLGGVVKRARRIVMGQSLSQSLSEHTHDGHTHSH